MSEKSRGWVRPVLIGVVPTIAVAGAVLWWLMGGRYISTENAYVKADIVQVSAEVPGRLIEIRVRDHAQVKAGEVILRIDQEPFAIALAKAEAEMDVTRAQVATLIASWHEAKSELKEAESKLAFHETQLTRHQQLAGRGVVPAAKLEEIESNAVQSRDRMVVMRQKLQRMAAQIGGNPELPADQHPLVREKRALKDRAALELQRTTLLAPASGTAVNVKLLVGEQIKASTPLFAIVADSRPWIEANFKETELTNVRKGQKATIVLDIYPEVMWQAVVESISPATGAEFALLPPQNASGNWVKVVQRLPVRLRLLERPDEPALRAGMTATVRVDTEQEARLSQLVGWGQAMAAGGRPQSQRSTAKE